MFELLAQMGEGLDADEAPEHHPQRRWQQAPLAVHRRQQRLAGARQITDPPDQRHAGDDGYGDQPLQHARGFRWTLAEQEDGAQRGQFDEQQVGAIEIEQRQPETAGDMQRSGQTDRQHGKEQQGADPLHAQAEGTADQVRRAASVREALAQLGEGERYRQHQGNQDHPCPQ